MLSNLKIKTDNCTTALYKKFNELDSTIVNNQAKLSTIKSICENDLKQAKILQKSIKNFIPLTNQINSLCSDEIKFLGFIDENEFVFKLDLQYNSDYIPEGFGPHYSVLIGIKFGSSMVKVTPIKEVYSSFDENEDCFFFHPHISGKGYNWSSLCLGDGFELYDSHRNEFNLIGMVDIILEAINSSGGSPYTEYDVFIESDYEDVDGNGWPSHVTLFDALMIRKTQDQFISINIPEFQEVEYQAKINDLKTTISNRESSLGGSNE